MPQETTRTVTLQGQSRSDTGYSDHCINGHYRYHGPFPPDAAIRQLLLTMPPPVVAKALGYHQVSATLIANQTGATWSGYAAGDHTDSHNPRPEPA
jgi:hypothetical protein